MAVGDRLKHAWDAFRGEGVEETFPAFTPSTTFGTVRPDRPRLRINSERTIISSIYMRIAIDAAAVRVEHCRLDADGQYVETMNSGLNECLNLKPNLDQGARHLRQDFFYTLCTEGVAAIIPVDTSVNPLTQGGFDIKSLRIGTILDWNADSVKLEAYNEKTGKREQLVLPKTFVAIVENPFYAVMNEANSTLKRLTHKLSMLDTVDEISSQGKLDIIIQLPYVTKTDTRKAQAQQRTREIQEQLQGSTYGIAYADATEKITQLNRSVENTLLEQVKYLQDQLYSELGLTPDIMNGTASDVVMLNYINRTIEPLMDAFTEAMCGTFLTKTARTQGQSMMYFQTPFRLLPISNLADVFDKLSRNQAITPNEIRPVLGLKPSKAPQANQLLNSNMPLDKQMTEETPSAVAPVTVDADEAKLDAEMAELGLS